MHLIFNVESKSIYQVCKGGNRLHCLFKYIMNKPDLTCANAYAKVPNQYPPTRNPKNRVVKISNFPPFYLHITLQNPSLWNRNQFEVQVIFITGYIHRMTYCQLIWKFNSDLNRPVLGCPGSGFEFIIAVTLHNL